MKFKPIFILCSFLCLLFVSVPHQVQAKGSVSTENVFIPFSFYQTGNFSLDTKTNKPDLFNFNVTTSDGSTIWISWRHNLNTVDVIMSSNQTGYIAVAWNPYASLSSSLTDFLGNSNVIVGSNNTVRDYTGYFNQTYSSIDKVVNSTMITDNQGIRMEFLYNITGSLIQISIFTHMIFATGSINNLDSNFNTNTTAVYVPSVYVGTWMDTGYPNWLLSTSKASPFADLYTILFAMAILPAIQLKRKLHKE